MKNSMGKRKAERVATRTRDRHAARQIASAVKKNGCNEGGVAYSVSLFLAGDLARKQRSRPHDSA